MIAPWRERCWRCARSPPSRASGSTRFPSPSLLPDEVLVEVETASVCGTDLHIYGWDEWSQGRIQPPLTLGHEFAGTIVETGSLVRDLAPGDYVSAESHITCGVCFQCRTGHAHMCERTRILGVDRDGAFARYVAVPASVIWRNDRTKLPPEIATLQEPFGNAVFATSEQDLAGRSVAVLGCGPIGLFTIGIARASGAATVVAADRTPFRLGLAEKMGASATVNVDETPDDGGVVPRAERGARLRRRLRDVGLAARRSPDAFRIARNGGRVILFGIPVAAGRDRRRRGADLQEPERARAERPQDLRDLVPDALAARVAASSTCGR